MQRGGCGERAARCNLDPLKSRRGVARYARIARARSIFRRCWRNVRRNDVDINRACEDRRLLLKPVSPATILVMACPRGRRGGDTPRLLAISTRFRRDFGAISARRGTNRGIAESRRAPTSSVRPTDTEGTVASSSKINEPFRRPWDVERALRERRIPRLMTDGRAITGMTADSHARSDIPAFFSPGISIFPDRAAPVFEIEHHHRWRVSAPATPRAVSPRFLTSRVPGRPWGCSLSAARLRAVRPPLRAFGFLPLSALVSVTTAGCPPVPSVFHPSSVLAFDRPTRPPPPPPPPRLSPRGSSPDTARLGIRICVGKSSARRLYDRLEFQFFGGQNALLAVKVAPVADHPARSRGEERACSCSRCKLACDRSFLHINVIDRSRAVRAEIGDARIEEFYKFKGQLRATTG